MKRTLIAISILFSLALPLVASAQSGAVNDTLTDNSFVFKGYYQGEKEESLNETIALTFLDNESNTINHDAQQGTEGTVVSATDNHVGQGSDSIFTWNMLGLTTRTVNLKFTFSTLQAHVNDKYFRPEYTITMTQDVSRKITVKRQGNTTGNPTQSYYYNDPFYSSAARIVGPAGATKTGTKDGPSDTEYQGAYSVEYRGSASGTGVYQSFNWGGIVVTTNYWYRSGTCILNISDYEKDKPGSYRYVCWVIAELSVE